MYILVTVQLLPALASWVTHSPFLSLSSLIHKAGTLILLICIMLSAGVSMPFNDTWSLLLRRSFWEHETGMTQPTNKQDIVNGISASSPFSLCLSALNTLTFYFSKNILFSSASYCPKAWNVCPSSGDNFYFTLNSSNYSL